MVDLIFFIGVVLVCLSVWQYKRKSKADTDDLEHIQKQIHRAKEDINHLIKEMTEISEQVVDTITDKIKAAQEVAGKLEVSTQNKQGEQANPSFASKAAKESKVIHLMDNRIAQNSVAGTTSKHQDVYALSDLGYSPEEIARKLAIGKGEVALILELKFKGEEVNGLKNY